MAQTSGTYGFSPSIAELVRAAFARCQIFPPAITIRHLADARMAINLLLSDWASNRGVDLGHVDQLQIPLTPGQIAFTLPLNTVDLLDVYLRTLTPSTTTLNIGNALTVLGPAGNPLVAQPYGDPILIGPGSNTLSCTAGSAEITLKWTGHGLSAGAPIFWGCPISIGGLAISGFSIVDSVIDANTLTFNAGLAALETQNNQGSTRLFSTNAGSATVDCIWPGHSLSVGGSFEVDIPLTIGGLTLSEDYTVGAVLNNYEFTFAPGGTASSAASLFENGGQLNVATQAAGVQYTDVPLFPLSRNDYAALPVKATPGRPTSFWLDRIVPPTFSIYPVAPTGSFYAFAAWRMREFQDAIPAGGETLDAPRRMWAVFVAELTAAMAEIYKPEVWTEKTQAAEAAWDRASSSDVERTNFYARPNFGVYFR